MIQCNRCSLILIIWLVWAGTGVRPTWAQIQIAPASLYLNDEQTTGRILVRNSSEEPQEIQVDLLFGYPDTNEEGQVIMKTFDSIPEDAPSAVEWVRVYPRHLVLPPQEQQVIRFSARPPADLGPGEYWARPAVSVSALQKPVSAKPREVSSHLHLIKRTLLSLNFRHQQVFTGLNITGISANPAGDTLTIMADLHRLGNAAYLGDVTVRISDGRRELLHHQEAIAVYNDQQRRFQIDISGLPPGRYTAEAGFDTRKRADRQQGIIEAPPVKKTIEFLKK